MAGTCEDALGALSERLGLPLEFRDGSCVLDIGGQPFTLTCDGELDRLVVSALVTDDLPEAPSRQLIADLLDLGFGMMQEGLPAVGRDPETGFIAAFAIYPCARLNPAEFPDSFTKFVAFASRLSERLDAERAGTHSPAPATPVSDAPSFGHSGFMQV